MDGTRHRITLPTSRAKPPESKSGEDFSCWGLRLFRPPNSSHNQLSGKKRERTMNPLIQLNRQVRYLFVALLFACFAIAQNAKAVGPEADQGDPSANTTAEDNASLDLSTDTENAETGQPANPKNNRVIEIKSPIQT